MKALKQFAKDQPGLEEVIRDGKEEEREIEPALAQQRGDQFIASELFLLALAETKQDIGRIARENRAYYLLGYEPSDRAARGAGLRRIEVTTTAPGVMLLHRVARVPLGRVSPLAAADPIVAEIRTIWQDVLQIPEIGLHEDLFDLGGHSLTVTRISSRIHRRLGVEVPLETFFDAPTIAEIADVVRDAATIRA